MFSTRTREKCREVLKLIFAILVKLNLLFQLAFSQLFIQTNMFGLDAKYTVNRDHEDHFKGVGLKNLAKTNEH